MTPPAPSDPDRARFAGRVLRMLIVAALLAHVGIAVTGWLEASGLPILGSRRDPQAVADVVGNAVSRAVGLLAVLTLAALLLSGWRRPRRPGVRSVPWEWPFAVALVVVAALLPVHGQIDWRTGEHLPASWTERACFSGVLLGAVASLVVFQLTVALVLARGPARAVRRESLRDGLAIWGFLLLAAAVLVVEGRTMQLMREVRLLGPRTPAWGEFPGYWLASNRLPLAFAFAGLVATLFGAWHLRRRGAPPEAEEENPLPPV